MPQQTKSAAWFHSASNRTQIQLFLIGRRGYDAGKRFPFVAV